MRSFSNRSLLLPSLWAIAVSLLFFGFSLSPRAFAANGEMNLPGYQVELDRWSALVDDAYLHPDQVPHLRGSLPAKWPVRVNRVRFEVSTDWLSAGLEAIQDKPGEAPAIRRKLISRLQALREEAVELASAGRPVALAGAPAELARIFQQREFRMRRATWFDYLRQWIGERLARLFRWVVARLHLRAEIGDVVGWIIALLAFLVFLALLRWSLARVQPLPWLRVPQQERPAEPHDWLAEALAAASSGDYRRAIHSAYWAAVVRLEALCVFPSDRSRTARETLRLVPASDARKESLKRLTDSFERIWYGFRPALPSDWAEAQTQLEKLGCGVRSTPLTAAF